MKDSDKSDLGIQNGIILMWIKDQVRVILEKIPAFRSKKTLIPYYIALEYKN